MNAVSRQNADVSTQPTIQINGQQRAYRWTPLLFAVFFAIVSGATAVEPALSPDQMKKAQQAKPEAAVASSSAPDGLSEWIRTDHLEQIRRLNGYILTLKQDRTWYDTNIVPTTLHSAATMLPSDQDAAEVLWRRTRTLLNEIRKLAPEVAAGFEAPLTVRRYTLRDDRVDTIGDITPAFVVHLSEYECPI